MKLPPGLKIRVFEIDETFLHLDLNTMRDRILTTIETMPQGICSVPDICVDHHVVSEGERSDVDHVKLTYWENTVSSRDPIYETEPSTFRIIQVPLGIESSIFASAPSRCSSCRVSSVGSVFDDGRDMKPETARSTDGTE